MQADKKNEVQLKMYAEFLMLNLALFDAAVLNRSNNPPGRAIILPGIEPQNSPFVSAAVRVARACIRGDFSAPDLQKDLLLLQNGANKLVVLEAQNIPRGRCRIVASNSMESSMRSIVTNLMGFTDLLAWSRPGSGYEPIGICTHCESLFRRLKRDQEFCSTKCRVAHWAEERGPEYFAGKQRERRAAAKKKQRKSVVKSEGKSLKKNRESIKRNDTSIKHENPHG